MSKTTLIHIQDLEVKKSALQRVKKLFQLTDDKEAIKRALDLASGKQELEAIFHKHKGTKIERVFN